MHSQVQLRLGNDADYTSKYTVHYNNFNYRGDNVEITKINTYAYSFVCMYHWQWYPFDSQLCQMKFQLYVAQSDQIKVGHLSLY